MTKIEKENQITALKNLGLSNEEVAKVLEDDEKIDKGEKLFDLPKELEKGAKKARSSGNTKGYTKPKEKTRPTDTTKRDLINLIAETLENVADNGVVSVTNAEREIVFTQNSKKYKIVLSCPRS